MKLAGVSENTGRWGAISQTSLFEIQAKFLPRTLPHEGQISEPDWREVTSLKSSEFCSGHDRLSVIQKEPDPHENLLRTLVSHAWNVWFFC